MAFRSTARSLALLLAPCLVLTALGRPAMAAHCPKYTFCKPKHPCVRYKCVCPKRICPGTLENFGYSPVCWTAWPFPPDYSHCPPCRITAEVAQTTLNRELNLPGAPRDTPNPPAAPDGAPNPPATPNGAPKPPDAPNGAPKPPGQLPTLGRLPTSYHLTTGPALH